MPANSVNRTVYLRLTIGMIRRKIGDIGRFQTLIAVAGVLLALAKDVFE